MALSIMSLLLIALSSSGCVELDQVSNGFDNVVFEELGGTVISSPSLMTMKELHLDNGALKGRSVIVEGTILEVSEHLTYLVLSDDTARMMVILTGLEMPLAGFAKDTKPQVLRVLGTVGTGKKGLPYVRARALNIPSAATSDQPIDG